MILFLLIPLIFLTISLADDNENAINWILMIVNVFLLLFTMYWFFRNAKRIKNTLCHKIEIHAESKDEEDHTELPSRLIHPVVNRKVQSKRNLNRFLIAFLPAEMEDFENDEESWWSTQNKKAKRKINTRVRKFMENFHLQDQNNEFAYEGIFDKKLTESPVNSKKNKLMNSQNFGSGKSNLVMQPLKLNSMKNEEVDTVEKTPKSDANTKKSVVTKFARVGSFYEAIRGTNLPGTDSIPVTPQFTKSYSVRDSPEKTRSNPRRKKNSIANLNHHTQFESLQMPRLDIRRK